MLANTSPLPTVCPSPPTPELNKKEQKNKNKTHTQETSEPWYLSFNESEWCVKGVAKSNRVQATSQLRASRQQVEKWSWDWEE